ncbi:MAG TPA: lipoyl(octanoyl) transferase LipB [Steroidobacteraceae bacterium]|nr:lipoyl(octanoyl) transferase LipB [Steroidobacteraceae bacterium]
MPDSTTARSLPAAENAGPAPLLVRQLGRVEYEPTWRAMQQFTQTRTASTADELWLLEHPPVYTLGMNADVGHVLAPGEIPVIAVDRGGQVTYHGPGQLVVYLLYDLTRAGVGLRDVVNALERAVIDYSTALGFVAECRRNAPGVYVEGRKLASVGLRIRRGASFHGLALNVNMDLEPFTRINPCGYAHLQMTQLADHGGPRDLWQAAAAFTPHLMHQLEAMPSREARSCA